MKIIFIQLSDIHIKSKDDPIFTKADKICDALQNLCPEASAKFILLTGDIAYSGSEEEYMCSIELIDMLRKRLSKGESPTYLLAIPGNHDLDLSESSSARDLILNEITRNPDRLLDSSFAAIALAPLKNFFQLRDCLDSDCAAKNDSITGGKLFTQAVYDLGNRKVAINLINTAALSKLHEAPGQLIFPTSIIIDPPKDTALCISILHHPYNWLKPENGKSLRNRIEAISDIILTGHEHVLDRRSSMIPEGANLYIEGGVLNDSDTPENSEFAAIVVDLEKKKQRLITFKWSDNIYTPSSPSDPDQFNLWEELLQSKLARSRSLIPNTEFLEFLDDPEVHLFHRQKNKVKLSDIFVPPDLKYAGNGAARNSKIIPAACAFASISEHPCAMLTGDDNSGKTAFSKSYFKYLLNRGDIPVWIDFSGKNIHAPKAEEHVEQRVSEIYGKEALNIFRQTEERKRILIIENYHKFSGGSQNRKELIIALRKTCFRLFLTANDMEVALQEIIDSNESTEGSLALDYYSILPFSVSRRDALVERWLLLGGATDAGTVRFIQNLERINGTIQTLVGKNYVPAYPPYLISVLQATEAGTDIELGASTHGYLYELFIKSSIAKYATAIDYHTICEYLSHVAFWMNQKKKKEISETELRLLHEKLQTRFEAIPNFEQQSGNLITAHMMKRRNDSFIFKHSYIYYYFLAYHFRDRMSDTAIKEAVAAMISSLDDEDNANTLLFLSHLSKDRLILTLLIQASNSQYPQVKPVTLSDDVKFLNDAHGEIKTIALPEAPFKDSRKEYLDTLEQENHADIEVGQIDKKHEAYDPLVSMNRALKTIQILGQILKNFPINLEREEKDAVIKSTTDLGRRLLGELFDLSYKNRVALLQFLAELIAKRKTNASAAELKTLAVTAMVSLNEMGAYGIIVRLTNAIGSDRLTSTYDRYFSTETDPFMKILNSSLRLNHYDHFPESLLGDIAKEMHENAFSFCILRQLIIRHFHVFPEDYRLKQRMGALFKIDYQKIRLPRREQQLLD